MRLWDILTTWDHRKMQNCLLSVLFCDGMSQTSPTLSLSPELLGQWCELANEAFSPDFWDFQFSATFWLEFFNNLRNSFQFFLLFCFTNTFYFLHKKKLLLATLCFAQVFKISCFTSVSFFLLLLHFFLLFLIKHSTQQKLNLASKFANC